MSSRLLLTLIADSNRTEVQSLDTSLIMDVGRIAALCEQGRSWPKIAKQLGAGVGKAYRAERQRGG
jgi:hypothetical protein